MTTPTRPGTGFRRWATEPTDSIRATLNEVRRIEGERGVAMRWSVLLRYLVYLAGVIIVSLIVGAMPALGPLATRLILMSNMLILVIAGVATVLYPVERRNLVDQSRFFIFGVVCFPSIVLGALLSLVSSASTNASGAAIGTSSDTLLVSLAQNALPYLFWATVLIPPFIFVKMVVGLRKIHRDRTDDEDMMKLWSRQDNMFR